MPIDSEQKKLTKIQYNILNLIKENQYISRPLIEEKTSSYYADIHNAIKSLTKDELIQEYKKKIRKEIVPKTGERKRGIQETFYIFTDKGIKTVIDENLSIEDFWKLVFFYFDKENKIKTSLSFEKVLNEFIDILKIDKTLILYNWLANSDSVITKHRRKLDGSYDDEWNKLNKSFLIKNSKLFSKIHWDYLIRFLDKHHDKEDIEDTLLIRFLDAFDKFRKDIDYSDPIDSIVLSDLVRLESKNSKKYDDLFEKGYEHIENQSTNENIKKLINTFNKEFLNIFEIRKNNPKKQVIQEIEKQYADYISFLFYADLVTSFPKFDWNTFLDRTNLVKWFESWKEKILESRRESIREIENILTI